MKFFLLVLFLFSLNSITSQIHSQKKEATIYFRDGSKIECIARIKGSEIIVFDDQGEKEKLDYRKVSKIKHVPIVGKGIFEYKVKIGYNEPILIELIKEDYLSLYGFFSQSTTNLGNEFIFNDVGVYYYVGKSNESTVTDFQQPPNKYGKQWWRKLSQEYFKDCDELVRKLKDKEFKQNDLVDIVEFYNSNCSNKL